MACALLWVAASSAVAQNNAQTDERLLVCDAINDEARRLACFNRVVEELRPEVVEESPPDAPAGSTDAPPVAAAVDADRRDKRDTDLTGNDTIVGVWENYDGRFTVELTNGALWRETEGTRVGIPEVGDGVTITRGVFGSYRMKIDGIARVAWVRQTE